MAFNAVHICHKPANDEKFKNIADSLPFSHTENANDISPVAIGHQILPE